MPITGGTANTDSGTSDDGYFNVVENTLSSRHTGGSNIVFVDGHAKWYTPGRAMSDLVLTGGAATCP